MSFAEEIVSQRQKLNISQGEVAKSIGVSRPYITLIESGKRFPGKKHLPKIATVLKVKKHIVINWYLKELRKKLS